MSTDQEEWAIVEIMGHLRRAGRVLEVERFGAKLLRVDIPVADGEFVTEFFGGSAIYRLRPCEEEIARAAAVQIGDPRPVKPLGWGERPAIEHHEAEFEDADFDETPF